MSAIKLETTTTIDEAAATAIPGLRPMLGQRVKLIAVPEEPDAAESRRKYTIDEVIAARLIPPAGVHVSIAEMDRAIERAVTGADD